MIPVPSNNFKATVIRIIDGDTVLAVLHLGFAVSIERPCRIRGYDSPEMRGPQKIAALKATQALRAVLPEQTDFLICCPSWSVDRYCRIVGDWYLLDGTLVTTLLPQEYILPKRP